MAIRFGIRSMLAVFAVYGLLLAAMLPLGVAGIIAALVSGTAISGVILLARRQNLGAIVRVTIGAIIGAILGLGCLSPMILTNQYGYDHGFGETAKSDIMGGIIGAIGGAFVASLITHSRRPTDPLE